MTTQAFIITLYCAVDQEMLHIPKQPDATLSPGEVVTMALLYALKGGGTRAFSHWLTRDYQVLFPQVPERTRLFRLCKTPTAWTAHFLAAPTVLGGRTPTALSASIRCAKDGAPRRWASKGKAIIGGLSAASCVLSYGSPIYGPIPECKGIFHTGISLVAPH